MRSLWLLVPVITMVVFGVILAHNALTPPPAMVQDATPWRQVKPGVWIADIDRDTRCYKVANDPHPPIVHCGER